MKQRVGIARALVMEPKVLLMDEPFGALDALTRAHLQDELSRIVGETRSTVVMDTHDVAEAVLHTDRIVMISNGPAATVGAILKEEIHRPPARATAWPWPTIRSITSTGARCWSSSTSASADRPPERKVAPFRGHLAPVQVFFPPADNPQTTSGVPERPIRSHQCMHPGSAAC